MSKNPSKAQTQKNGKGNGGLATLLKELWNAAVALRGNIEPSDYKRYVLPLIFLRFLSLRYEKRRSEIDSLAADPKSDFYTPDSQLALQLREDPDLYTAGNVFLVPEEARWDSIVKIARADDIKLRLDRILQLLEDTFPKLKGLLPPIYAGSNLDHENIAGLINLFSKDIFKSGAGGLDMLGRVYEYFIGEFASSEGKRGGEYFTPASIVKLLVAMLEPTEGKVFDPCCGSGGMFVQSDHFAKHSGKLSFFGQESKDFTYRLCRLNLFIHGLDGDIRLGNSYINDQHSDLKADYILANPPFNDGSKGEKGWGAHLIDPKDARLIVGDRRIALAEKNANYMWMLHFLHHLADGGTAGFVMANGALRSDVKEEREAREALLESGFVDCVVQMPDKLFANVPISCSLWFLSKNRNGSLTHRPRQGKILFIDARGKAGLIEGSRRQKEFSDDEINQIAYAYHNFCRRNRAPENIEGFCRTVPIADVRKVNYVLTPGYYVGTEEDNTEDGPYHQQLGNFTQELERSFAESTASASAIKATLATLSSSAFGHSFKEGELPEGWRRVTIAELASNIQYGLTQSASRTPIGPHFLRITDIQGGRVDWATVPFCRVTPDEHERYRLKVGDILVARTGASTGENIYLAEVPGSVFASYLVRFQFPNPSLARFVGAFMRTKAYFDYIAGCIGGSAQPNASAQVLAAAEIVCPPQSVIEEFARLTATLDRRIGLNEKEATTLRTLRDGLLPKIASGDIRILQAEKLVEAAT